MSHVVRLEDHSFLDGIAGARGVVELGEDQAHVVEFVHHVLVGLAVHGGRRLRPDHPEVATALHDISLEGPAGPLAEGHRGAARRRGHVHVQDDTEAAFGVQRHRAGGGVAVVALHPAERVAHVAAQLGPPEESLHRLPRGDLFGRRRGAPAARFPVLDHDLDPRVELLTRCGRSEDRPSEEQQKKPRPYRSHRESSQLSCSRSRAIFSLFCRSACKRRSIGIFMEDHRAGAWVSHRVSRRPSDSGTVRPELGLHAQRRCAIVH